MNQENKTNSELLKPLSEIYTNEEFDKALDKIRDIVKAMEKETNNVQVDIAETPLYKLLGISNESPLQLEEGVIYELSEAQRVRELEKKKKHCKNYMELKQINKELNVLKFRKGKHNGNINKGTGVEDMC